MNSHQAISLKPYHTFGLDVFAQGLQFVHSVEDFSHLQKAFRSNIAALYMLGGGSNVLFTQNWPGTIVINQIKGIEIVAENSESIDLTCGAGENWHEVVMYTVQHGWGGLENLSLIPGSVGAAPMQNIGAYGVEIKDVFVSLEAYHIQSGTMKTFTHSECKFGYRESFFKGEGKNQYWIANVTFRLQKRPQIRTSYGAIQQELEKMGILTPNIMDVSKAVIAIRQSKLPDPKVLGNAGSFFKNPEIPNEQAAILAEKYPNMPQYPSTKPNETKLAAGWLIEQCGWKGKVVGHTGAHKQQALVLVNYGGATGKEIVDLSKEIQKSIQDKFGVQIDSEVNII